MWCVLFWLLCVSLMADIQCLAEADDASPQKEEKPKVVYTKPTVPEDSVLTLPFDSPEDVNKLTFSEATKEGVNVDIAKYDGKWEIEIPKTSSVEGDYSLVLKSEGKHHAVAIDIGKDLQFDKDEFVVQYEVKFMEGLSCGGAYIKLLSASNNMNLSQFYDKTPYTIMFGPDKCGLDSKIHFIFRHKNPKTGDFEEKHMKQPTESLESFFTDKKTHLYTLVIRSDNSFEVYVDQSLIKSGNLLSDFVPPVNPPSEIDDPNDKKPSDWDDRVQIPDATATKPDDWDEDAPEMIRDEAATMPEGWLENEPKLIAKPDAEQPEDWDSETDGDWEPPMVDNPICASVPGCGKWEKPMIQNPNYRGKWSPPMIANKGYKGEWKARKIPNPDYFEDTEPYRMTPIRALGLELWTMSSQIAFDNFYIGISKKGADRFAEETWIIKRNAEKTSGRSVVDAVRDLADEKPWIIALAVGVVLLIVLLVFWCCRSGRDRIGDAVHKKTDEVTRDNTEDEDEENEENSITGQLEKKASSESEEEKEKEEKSEHSDGEEHDEPKKTVRQRTRKE